MSGDLGDTSESGPVPLPDGDYEVFIIDVDDRDDHRRLDLTIVSGDHKGEVLTVVATGLEGEFTDLIGMPATVTITAGAPSVTVDS